MDIFQIIPTKSLDIEITPHEGNSYLIVHKKLNHYVKVNQLVRELLKFVDGKRTIKDVSEKFNGVLNKNITAEKVYEILYKDLGEYHIIENNLHEYKPSGKPNYLKLSFKVIPKEKVKPIAKFLSPLYSKKVFYPLFFICLAFLFTIGAYNYTTIGFELFSKLNTTSAFLIGFGVVFTLFMHEFGHAAACYHFGGKLGDIGFGFYLISPVMFADVSDIWKLHKNKRVVVNLGGLHIQIIIASILGVLFLITNSIELLLLVYLLGIISVLVNLNPFFRTDGYWVLSDITEVNNLRAVSNQKLRTFFKQLTKKEKFIYTKKNILLFLYAVVSNLFIVVFLGWILFTDYNRIFSFPITLYNFIKNTLSGNINFSYTTLKQFTIPLLFYYISGRVLYRVYKNNIKRIKLIDKKEFIKLGIGIVLSTVYLLSAVGKTIEFTIFKEKIQQYLFGLDISAYAILGIEYFLVISFGGMIFKNLASKLSIIFLIFLSLIYSYGYFFLNIKECDCFGSFDILNSSKIGVVLIKNAVLIVLSIVLLNKFTKKIKRNQYKVLVSIGLVCLLTFQVYKLNASQATNYVYKNTGKSINDVLLYLTDEMKDANYWFLFSPNCIHCKKAIPHINKLIKEKKKVAGITLEEKEEDFKKLKNTVNIKFPVSFIPKTKLKKLTKKVPVLFEIKNDTIIKVYKQINKNTLHE